MSSGVTDRAGWLDAARALVAELRAAVAPWGLQVSDELAVADDGHPCPGYREDLQTIVFAPPVVEGAVDRLRWMFFARVMGVVDVAEAAAFYRDALPFIIAHEVAHHLRFLRGRSSPSPFVEEQVCDRIAIALLDAIPAHRAGLPRLRAWCVTMRDRLATQHGAGAAAGYLPGLGEALLGLGELAPEQLARLEAYAHTTDASLEELAELAVGTGATTRAAAWRGEASTRVDLHYTSDPAEYWYLSVGWTAAYLARNHRPDLADVLRDHLLDSDARGRDEVQLAFAQLLDDTGGEHRLAAVVRAIGDADPEVATAVLDGLATTWPTGLDASAPIARLVADHQALPARPVLRLAGLAGVTPPAELIARARAGDDDARLEALAAEPDDAEALADALARPDRAGVLLEAWLAWGRPRSALPAEPLARLLAEPPPRVRRLLARLATVEELIAALPRRGSTEWDAVVARLDGGALAVARAVARDGARASPQRLRAAALVCDLGGEPMFRDAMVAAELRRADGLRTLAHAFANVPSRILAPLAAEQLDLDARHVALDVARCLAARELADSVHRLAERAAVTGPIAPELVALIAAAVAEPDRDAVAAVLEARAPSGDPARAASASASIVSRSPLHAAALLPTSALEPIVITTIEKTLALRQVPLFARLEPRRLWELATLAVEVQHGVGDVIVAEGEPGARLYLVIEGRVRVDKQGVALAELGTGEAFGEVALLDGEPRSASVRAVAPCRLLTLSAESLRRVGRDHPEVYEGLMLALCERLRATSARMAG